MRTLMTLFAAGLALTQVSATNGAIAERTVYLSIVSKGSVNKFFNRFSLGKTQLVVTEAPVAKAKESISVTYRPEEESLYLSEGVAVDAAKLSAERARLGSVRVVVAAKTHELHMHDVNNPKAYFEKVESIETTSSVRAGTKSIELAAALRRDVVTTNDLEIDVDFLKSKLEEFSGEKAALIDGQNVTISERGSDAGRKKARAYLRSQYEALGFTTSEQAYRTGSNFVAERAGADTTKFLIVSAHLDSVHNAGADDDGAGTISALALATALQDLPLKFNLRIVGFDEEEKGLVGSKAYAKHLASSGQMNGLVGVINLEMTGYDKDNDGAFHVIDCEENTSAQLTQVVMKMAQAHNLSLRKVEACTNRSDHAVFWQHNKPAVVIAQNFFGPEGDSNPCYHKACDRVNILNFDYMRRITTASAYAVRQIIAASEAN